MGNILCCCSSRLLFRGLFSRSFQLANRKKRLLTGFALLLMTFVTFHAVYTHSWTPSRLMEIEGLIDADPFVSFDSRISSPLIESSLSTELRQRFRYAQYPICDNNFDRFSNILQPYTPKLLRRHPIAIAINLHNSADIIPAQSIALVEAISYLLSRHKVYLSIFENGSTDRTKERLADLAAALDRLGIDGLFIRSSHLKSDFQSDDRIILLSELRNQALDRLLPHANGGTLIFLNDVITCASDILELVYQRMLQQADAVVSNDWTTLGSSPYPRLYDLWVTRGINGGLPYEFETDSGFNPSAPTNDWIVDMWRTQSLDVQERWLSSRPLPIYSGWGGMAAFDANLFTKLRLRFRSSISSGWRAGGSSRGKGAWGELVTKDYLMSDCPGASECEYIFRDIWNLRDGRARIAASPRARTAYDIQEWMSMATFIPPDRGWLRTLNRTHIPHVERIDWSKVSVPSSVVCIPGRDRTGEQVAIWGTKRYLIDPTYRVIANDSDHKG